MSNELVARLIEASVATVVDHADELTALDSAIGDGDHGINMKRGFDAIAAQIDELSQLDLPAALQKAGMTLVMKVGGASGPLYGSLLMAMGKSGAMGNSGARHEAGGAPAGMLAAGVEAVKARGKSDVGEKTMLDVLVPVLEALEAGADLERLRAVADAAQAATIGMKATKGRASFLGERSIGHVDPGARSSCLLVHAACAVFGAQA
ncbi:MAG: dihydroxyacetone kinase subunit DhaL [Gammaproteobacteria bacterium]